MSNASAARKMVRSEVPAAATVRANPVHDLLERADREMAAFHLARPTPAVERRLSPRTALLMIGATCTFVWAIPAVILF